VAYRIRRKIHARGKGVFRCIADYGSDVMRAPQLISCIVVGGACQCNHKPFNLEKFRRKDSINYATLESAAASFFLNGEVRLRNLKRV
jgi:hypothetical protein